MAVGIAHGLACVHVVQPFATGEVRVGLINITVWATGDEKSKKQTHRRAERGPNLQAIAIYFKTSIGLYG